MADPEIVGGECGQVVGGHEPIRPREVVCGEGVSSFGALLVPVGVLSLIHI